MGLLPLACAAASCNVLQVALLVFPWTEVDSVQNILVVISSAVAVSIERSVLGVGSGGDVRHLLPR